MRYSDELSALSLMPSNLNLNKCFTQV